MSSNLSSSVPVNTGVATFYPRLDLGEGDDKDCVICTSPMNGSGALVGHFTHIAKDGTHKYHTFHKDCIKQSVKFNPQCPICRQDVEIGTFYPLKERIIDNLTNNLKVVGVAGRGFIFSFAMLTLLESTHSEGQETLPPLTRLGFVAAFTGTYAAAALLGSDGTSFIPEHMWDKIRETLDI